jgi:Ribonuclease D
MAALNQKCQLWDVSRGIVFAGEPKVFYPNLVMESYHTAAATATDSEAQSACVAVASMGEIAKKPTRRRRKLVVSDVEVTATEEPVTMSHTSASAEEEPVPEDGEEVEEPIGNTIKKQPENSSTMVPPFTPLPFKIPEELFRAAKQAAEGSPQSFWSYSMYRGPDDERVKVHYCTSQYTTERVLQNYFAHEEVLGFDLEWETNATRSRGPRKNVSLIQIASPSRVGLFHVAKYPFKGSLVPPTLKQIMENPKITKVGVAIKGDCRRMEQHLDIKCRGILELSHLYKLVRFSRTGEYNLINKRLVSLAFLVEECLGLPLFKGADVRTSHWANVLDADQIECKFTMSFHELSLGAHCLS